MAEPLNQCHVCLDIFANLEVLACAHALCMNCIDLLPVDGAHRIYCPTCRKPTNLYQDGSASLPPTIYGNTFIETYHSAKPIGDNKCHKHHDRLLEMYCDHCQKVVCTKCERADHRNHNCGYISDILDQYWQEINDHLQPVKQQHDAVQHALYNLEYLQDRITSQGESVKDEIDEFTAQLDTRLKQDVDALVERKVYAISIQKQEGDVYLTELKSCEQHVQDKLHNGSQQEILQEKKVTIETLKSVIQESTLQTLQPKEKADIAFKHGHDIAEGCSISSQKAFPDNIVGRSKTPKRSKTPRSKKAVSLYPQIPDVGGNEVSVDSVTTNAATLKRSVVRGSTAEAMHTYNSLCKVVPPMVAVTGMLKCIDVTVPDTKCPFLNCNLVHDRTGIITECKIEHDKNNSHVSFTATNQGSHSIRIQARGFSIPCDPSNIEVVPSIQFKDLHTPIAIATTTSGLFVVATNTSIAVIDKEFKHRIIKNSQGGGFNTGVCVTPDDCILVVSSQAPHITKYSINCTLEGTACTSHGSEPLQFDKPQDIAVSIMGYVYVCDTGNNRVQVLNPNLKFSRKFGESGSGPGQFKEPHGLVLGSNSMNRSLYVCDTGNNRVQIFSSSGEYISEFQVPLAPRYIAIEHNTLYITVQYAIVVYTASGENTMHRSFLPYEYWYHEAGRLMVNANNLYLCDSLYNQIIIY